MVIAQENEVSGIDLKIKNNDPKPNGSKRSEGKKYYARGLRKLKLDTVFYSLQTLHSHTGPRNP